jgi:opacity protein-like surface antigen
VRTVPVFLIVAWLGMLPRSPAGEADDPSREVREAASGKESFADRFRKGSRDAALSLGVGFGTRAVGNTEQHDLTLAAAELGWVVRDRSHDDGSRIGSWEVVGVLFGGAERNLTREEVVGGAALLRFNVATRGSWVPFVNAGAGIAYTEIRGTDLSTDFQFTVQAGGGAHRRVAEKLALTLQYRWVHLSNADLEKPNNGVDSSTLFVGLTWLR